MVLTTTDRAIHRVNLPIPRPKSHHPPPRRRSTNPHTRTNKDKRRGSRSQERRLLPPASSPWHPHPYISPNGTPYSPLLLIFPFLSTLLTQPPDRRSIPSRRPLRHRSLRNLKRKNLPRIPKRRRFRRSRSRSRNRPRRIVTLATVRFFCFCSYGRSFRNTYTNVFCRCRCFGPDYALPFNF